METPEFMRKLDTMAKVNAKPRATAKHKLILRVEENGDKAKADVKALEDWKKSVWRRDRNRCRVCGRKVVKSLALVPERGEIHHLVGRSAKAVRTDRRNGLLVCAAPCHVGLTRHRIVVIGTAKQMFTGPDSKSYLNADEPLTFKVTK